MNKLKSGCALCQDAGGELLWQDALCRVVRVDDADYPGFCRVIVHRHVREMTDLTARERDSVMAVVFAVEQAVRDVMQPEKINLASLGNVTPHLHWHVIPRFLRDKTFPASIWSASRREAPAFALDVATARRLKQAVQQLLDQRA